MGNLPKIILIAVAFLSFIIAILPQSRETYSWYRASFKSSSESVSFSEKKAAFESYLKSWPHGKYSTEAKQNFDEFSWQEALDDDAKGVVNAFDIYIDENPQGKYLSLAMKKMDKYEWDLALGQCIDQADKAEFTIQNLKSFIKNNPNNRFLPEARKKLEEFTTDTAAFERALGFRTKDEVSAIAVKYFSKFVKDYPNSPLVPKALNEIYTYLSEKFPKRHYWPTISLERVKIELPIAIKENKALIVAYTPFDSCNKAHNKGAWYMVSTFVELAGHKVDFSRRTPLVKVPSGEQYVLWKDSDEEHDFTVYPYSSINKPYELIGFYKKNLEVKLTYYASNRHISVFYSLSNDCKKD